MTRFLTSTTRQCQLRSTSKNTWSQPQHGGRPDKPQARAPNGWPDLETFVRQESHLTVVCLYARCKGKRLVPFLFLLFGDFTGQFRGTVAAVQVKELLKEMTLLLCRTPLLCRRCSLPGTRACTAICSGSVRATIVPMVEPKTRQCRPWISFQGRLPSEAHGVHVLGPF